MRPLIFLIYISILSLLLYSIPSRAEFTHVSNHPSGQSLTQIVGYKGGVFANTSTHYRFDAEQHSFVNEFTQRTTSVGRMRVIDDKLYVTSLTPTGHAYAVRGNDWSAVATSTVTVLGSAPAHFRDIVKYDDQLWLIGDQYYFGQQTPSIAKKSIFGWEDEKLEVGLSDDNTFCFAATLGETLYVELADLNCDPSFGRSFVSLLPGFWATKQTFGTGVRKTGEFAKRIVFIKGSHLTSFNGSSFRRDHNAPVHDYTIFGNTLIVLRVDGQVCGTTDLINYDCFDRAPVRARSITTVGEHLFVGTNGSRMYKSENPYWVELTLVMAPIIALLLDDS